MKSIIVIGTLPSSLINFRGDLLKRLVADGWNVHAMATKATPEEIRSIENLGVNYIDFPVQRSGLNPISDLRTLKFLKKKFKEVQPDAILAYTIKPVIWGGLASKIIPQAKFVALITGLGFTFQKGGTLKNCLTYLITKLYKSALKNSEYTIFQNTDNRAVFVDQNIVEPQKTRIINGSGVNIRRYKFDPVNSKNTQFLLIARLLKDKGIAEYIQAAKNVKKTHPEAVFTVLGPKDPSPNAYPFSDVETYVKEGVIEYISEKKDVRPYIKDCQIYVLPSYHEGLPRTVLEAMAIGRPIITTDAPGCRDTTAHNENGYLVPSKDSKALEAAMIKMIENRQDWAEMGAQSRRRVEEIFDVDIINTQFLNLFDELINPAP